MPIEYAVNNAVTKKAIQCSSTSSPFKIRLFELSGTFTIRSAQGQRYWQRRAHEQRAMTRRVEGYGYMQILKRARGRGKLARYNVKGDTAQRQVAKRVSYECKLMRVNPCDVREFKS